MSKDDVPELKVRPKKTIHAIAHFDFDGSCENCPCSPWTADTTGWEVQLCCLGKFNVEKVPRRQRHELCPLCIEEDL